MGTFESCWKISEETQFLYVVYSHVHIPVPESMYSSALGHVAQAAAEVQVAQEPSQAETPQNQ